MGCIAFLWGGWTLQNKFAKTGEIKGDTYLHGVRYDNKKVLLCFIVTQDVTLIYNFINSIIAPVIMKFNRFIQKNSRFVY